jgi:hypothetical protein
MCEWRRFTQFELVENWSKCVVLLKYRKREQLKCSCSLIFLKLARFAFANLAQDSKESRRVKMDGVIFDAHEDSAGHAYFTAEFGGTDEEVGSYQITLLRREESKVIIPILGQRAEKLGEVTFQVGSPQGPILEAVGRAKEAV